MAHNLQKNNGVHIYIYLSALLEAGYTDLCIYSLRMEDPDPARCQVFGNS